MAKEKRQYTLWYYSVTALDEFGGTEEVELEIDPTVPEAAQSDVFDPAILENSPTYKPVVAPDDWYRCAVLAGWGCNEPEKEHIVYNYYRTW